MENSVIAVQIANGTFVPVLNTSSAKRRRLVLTTVRDNQTNVKIDLFRGSDESMSDPEYVGSLVIDNLEPAEKGSADISVLLGVDENGSLNATATDTKSGEYQSLSVGLEELEQDGYDVPDFQLSDEELTLDELSMEEEEIGGEGEAEVPAGDEEPFGDFDLGDFETELAEARETTGDEAEPPTEEVAETPSQPPGTAEELGDLSFDDLEAPGEGELESLEELELEPEPEAEPEAELELGASTEEPEAEPELEPEPEAEPELEASTDEPVQITEQADTLADISDEEFSFDESFSDEFSALSDTEPEGPDDLDLSSLTAEEGGGGDEFDMDTDFDGGMVEADLGDEDFTFDEGAEDEPLFGEPEAEVESEPSPAGEEIEDTLSPEEFDRLDSQPPPVAPELEGEEEPLAPRRSNAIVFAGYLVLALAALGVLTYLVFRVFEGPPAPPLRASLPGRLVMGSIVWGMPIVGGRPQRTRRRVSNRRRR